MPDINFQNLHGTQFLLAHIGLIIGCLGFALFSGFFILQKSDRWHSKASYLVGSHALAAAGLLLICVSSKPCSLPLPHPGWPFRECHYLLESILCRPAHEEKGEGDRASRVHSGSRCPFRSYSWWRRRQFAGLRAPYLFCLVVLFVAVIVEIVILKRVNTHAVGHKIGYEFNAVNLSDYVEH